MNISSLFSLRRWRQELVTPTKTLTKILLEFVYFIKKLRKKPANSKRRNLLIWDWTLNPVTFDFLFFLFQAWFEFKKQGNSFFDIVIFTEGKPSLSKKYQQIVPPAEVQSRVKKLILPIANLFEPIGKVFICKDFNELQQLLPREEWLALPNYYNDKYRPIRHN